ncbi:MAG TPA: tetratricopeptide repeat protein [Ignavibacteriaceae bacterium]
MKFKTIYFYAILVLAAIIFLILFSRKENSTQHSYSDEIQNQKIPDDEIHNPLKTPGSNPSKENVSKEFHERMAELKQAVENNPKDTVKLKEYADFLSAAHKTDEALQMYERILKINPKRSDIYFSITLLYYTKNDLEKAEEYNSKVLEYDPENYMALYNKGAIAATKGDKESARLIWEKIIDKSPDSEVGNLAKQSLSRL